MTEKILVVDDDAQTVTLVGLALQREGYDIVPAHSGEEALQKAIQLAPALVILDVMMPGISGLEVCHRLRENPTTATTPILLFSAKAGIDDRLAGFEAGADGYVTKPVHPKELVSRVQGLLLRSSRSKPSDEDPPPNVIGFLGSKGGVGTTTLAVNVGVALALGQAKGQRVVLVELHAGMATAGLQLGLPEIGRITTILDQPLADIDVEMVEAQLDQHKTGLLALTGQARPSGMATSISADHGELIVEHLGTLADYVLVDLGAGLNDVNRRVLPRCRHVAVVVGSNPISLMLARMLLDALNESLHIPRHRISLVLVNLSHSSFSVTKDTFEGTLQHSLNAVISAAPEMAFTSSGRHEPIMAAGAESFVAQQYRDVAEGLLKAL